MHDHFLNLLSSNNSHTAVRIHVRGSIQIDSIANMLIGHCLSAYSLHLTFDSLGTELFYLQKIKSKRRKYKRLSKTIEPTKSICLVRRTIIFVHDNDFTLLAFAEIGFYCVSERFFPYSYGKYRA